MNDCCKHLHREAIKELGFKDKRISELEKEVTRLLEPTKEFWNNEASKELTRLKAENKLMIGGLEFYSNIDNWDETGIGFNDTTERKESYQDKILTFYEGGKRARNILKTINEKKEG